MDRGTLPFTPPLARRDRGARGRMGCARLAAGDEGVTSRRRRASLREVIDLDLEESFVELLRSARTPVGVAGEEKLMFGQVLYTPVEVGADGAVLLCARRLPLPTMIMRVGYATVDYWAVANSAQRHGGRGHVLRSPRASLCVRPRLAPYVIDSLLRHDRPAFTAGANGRLRGLRFLAGATLADHPDDRRWLGGWVATAATTIPPTMHAYPGGVAIRFLFASLVA